VQSLLTKHAIAAST